MRRKRPRSCFTNRGLNHCVLTMSFLVEGRRFLQESLKILTLQFGPLADAGALTRKGKDVGASFVRLKLERVEPAHQWPDPIDTAGVASEKRALAFLGLLNSVDVRFRSFQFFCKHSDGHRGFARYVLSLGFHEKNVSDLALSVSAA